MKIPEAVGDPRVVWQGTLPDGRPLPGKAVLAQEFRFPDGTTSEFYSWKGGRPVIVLPFTRSGEIILVRQWRSGSNSVIIEAAGGHPDKEGESPEETLAREFREETGYQAEGVVKIPSFFLDPPSNGVVVSTYIAYGCTRVGEMKLDPAERMERVVMPFKDWLRSLWRESDDKDSKTITALFLALPKLPMPLRRIFLSALGEAI